MTLAISISVCRQRGRLPSRTLLAWCCGNDFDLLLFGFLGLPIASLLAFGHVDLVGFEDEWNAELAKFVVRNYHSIQIGETCPDHIWRLKLDRLAQLLFGIIDLDLEHRETPL